MIPLDRHSQRHDRAELGAAFERSRSPPFANHEMRDREAVAAIFNFLGAYDQKWRETSEFVVTEGAHPGACQ